MLLFHLFFHIFDPIQAYSLNPHTLPTSLFITMLPRLCLMRKSDLTSSTIIPLHKIKECKQCLTVVPAG